MPTPVPGLDLVIEPRFRRKGWENFRWERCYHEDGTEEIFREEPAPEPSPWRQVNRWWSHKLFAEVLVLRNEEGRARYGLQQRDPLSFTLNSIVASQAWRVEAEQKALRKLASFVSAEDFNQYLLTGHLEERSKRSGLLYLFRKGRPTIALREEGAWMRPLCVLCLHPIGYYADSWAGVMCPTDEVIAHLLMMRGSEEKFWANANQHPANHPAAGI